MAVLPVRRVVLYKHGVGYFEREGKVTGDAVLECTVRQSEVSDVLKSLTVIDLDGGQVAAVSYDSTRPPEKRLADIALNVPDQQSLIALLPQLKGARVAVGVDDDREFTGTLLGIDTAETRTADGVSREVLLSLVDDDGEVLIFDLYESSVRLLDEALRRDLDYYLKTQLSAKKRESRTFAFHARGTGGRRVRLGYVTEAPVWKATYRLLLPDRDDAKAKPHIQGWAVVDNAGEEDWDEVELTLVAGLPVSFVHDLYTPRYVRRPTVAVQETTGVLPPVVEEGVPDVAAMMMLEVADVPPAAAAPPAAMRKMRARSGMGSGGAASPQAVAASAPVQVRERQVGELFEYAIDKPVSVRRDQSALVPIVFKPFDGKGVLLYQKAARADNPLRCVEFDNTTGLTLEGGPVTVLDDGRYVGEAMLETTRPGEQRLVGYAVELGVRVTDGIDSHTEDVARVVIRNGVMKTYAARVQTTTYTVVNKTPRDETVYLDHPRPGRDWELIDTPKPHETTDNYRRFKFDAAGGRATKLVVKERQKQVSQFALKDVTAQQLGFWLEQKYVDADTAKQLKKAADARRRVASLDEALAKLDRERDAIHKEQHRIRENLGALGDRPSEKELRERFVRTLAQQEDRLEAIERDRAARTDDRDAARAELDAVLAGLDYEGAVGPA